LDGRACLEQRVGVLFGSEGERETVTHIHAITPLFVFTLTRG